MERGVTRPAHRCAGLLCGLLLMAVAGTAQAAAAITGYGSAEFGMSPDEVRERLAEDGITAIGEEWTEEGDLLIDGRLDGEPPVATDLRYVFPAGSERLALVVAFHPEVADHAAVKARLEADYGAPWEAEMAEWWLEQLAAGMPETPLDFAAWGGDDERRQRFVRLWAFEEYLSVEYLDSRLLSGR